MASSCFWIIGLRYRPICLYFFDFIWFFSLFFVCFLPLFIIFIIYLLILLLFSSAIHFSSSTVSWCLLSLFPYLSTLFTYLFSSLLLFFSSDPFLLLTRFTLYSLIYFHLYCHFLLLTYLFTRFKLHSLANFPLCYHYFFLSSIRSSTLFICSLVSNSTHLLISLFTVIFSRPFVPPWWRT